MPQAYSHTILDVRIPQRVGGTKFLLHVPDTHSLCLLTPSGNTVATTLRSLLPLLLWWHRCSALFVL